jgi:hypothetical protein
MFSSHCGLDFRFSPRGNIAASKTTLSRGRNAYAEELYKVLDTETDTTFKQQIDVDISHGQPLRGQNVVKDGIHIIFKNVHLTATIQQLIRQRVLTVRTYPDVAPTGPTQQCGRRTGRACDYQQLANGRES